MAKKQRQAPVPDPEDQEDASSSASSTAKGNESDATMEEQDPQHDDDETTAPDTSTTTTTTTHTASTPAQLVSFATLAHTVGLDVRLRKAVARLGHSQPTPVQSATWEQALVQGRDVVMKAPTGSGKTIAYAIPLLQRMLSTTNTATSTSHRKKQQHAVAALVLVPTKELCHQVAGVLRELSYYCDEHITIGVVSTSRDTDGTQQAALRDRPNVLVATPSALVATTYVHPWFGQSSSSSSSLSSSMLQTVVMDEADLVLSFGYQQDVERIVQQLLPSVYHGFLVSATLSPDVQALQQIVLHNHPVVIHVAEAKTASGKLKQFYLPLAQHADKALLLYVFLKLGVLRGKGLLFVATTNAGYKLKLILEQFFVRTAVLNAELPLRSRLNIIEQFNLGSFDYLIATDASTDQPSSLQSRRRRRKGRGLTDKEASEEEEDAVEDEGDDDADEDVEADGDDDEESVDEEKPNKRHRSRKNKRSNSADATKDAQEYGVSRGVDFRNVSFVVNVDMPATPKDYAHRIGRTARGGAKGVALSLVVDPHEFDMLAEIQETQPRLDLPKASSETLQASTAVDEGSTADQQQQQPQPVLLDFNVSEIEGFRYRVEDVSRGITRQRVQDARAEELRAEILHAERLRLSAPDVQLLAQPSSTALPLQDHLKHVPDYLLPRGMQVANLQRKRKKRKRKFAKQRGGGNMHNKKDPLQNFSGDVTLEGLEDGAQPFQQEDAAVVDKDEDDGDASMPETTITAPGATGTGTSTSRRRAWKERHGKGEFSKKKRLTDRKFKQPLGI